MTKNEILGLISRAIVEDDSIVTGRTRSFPQGLLVEVLPEDDEPAHAAVTRARDLMVEALNSDDMPETGTAVALGEHRFRLDMFDGSQWIGSVAAFAGHYLQDLTGYWPERGADAPGEVFALRVVPLRVRGGASACGEQ